MLIELHIENLAVIERLSLRLGSGLTVFTGETGTGKSIIVGALSLLLGERASTEAVRAGAARAVVEGVFDVSGLDGLRERLKARGLDTDDGLLILRREIAVEGRSRSWVNGGAATAALVGEIGRALVDFHGQHEHQTLIRADEQRAILDAWSGCEDRVGAAGAALLEVRDLSRRLDSLEEKRRSIGRRVLELRDQAEAIEKARLSDGEEERLEQEAHRLAHADELARLANDLHQVLYAADDAVGARLDDARRTLAHLLRLDPGLSEAARQLEDAFQSVQELGRQLGEYGSRVENDPGRLDELRRRMDLLFRLRARYGPTLADVIRAGQAARSELEQLEGSALDEKALRARLAEAHAAYDRLAAELSAMRAEGAARLDAEVNRLLPRLAMEGGRFVTHFERLREPGAHGLETVEFRVSANAGFEPAALARVASGGELSRIMLALKAILARHDRLATLVFDEIDSGIGGATAAVVAERLRDVAGHHQVFVVTHLPQIAALADHHLAVRKDDAGGRAATSVDALEGEVRVAELARMLGGDAASETGRAHARALLTRHPR
jgi:DNA repair protein RecN (Recombination protein N)